jgi:hypothetical protein
MQEEGYFGRLVLDLKQGLVHLDLSETPDLVCSGFFLGDPASAFDSMNPRREILQDTTLEINIEQEPLVQIDREVRAAEMRDKEAFAFGELMFYEVGDQGFELGLDIGRPLWPERRNLWAGSANSRDPDERFNFILEQFSSPDPYTVIAAVWVAFFLGLPLIHILRSDCTKRAEQACGGSSNVKHVKSRRTVSSNALFSGNMEDECEFECWQSSPEEE